MRRDEKNDFKNKVMIQIISKEDCCGCYACSTICSQQCIMMEVDQEGFNYPVIDEKSCTDCGLCEKVCPVINRFTKTDYQIKVFACKNNDDKIRFKSSSGGIFSLLAETVIKKNGVVFGARFNDSFAVVHDFTENIDGIEAFRGSKYVQSQINDNYKKAEKFLKQDRYVLFTGTSCQIAGLKHYLKKEYEKLCAVDVVCHGVPSPKVFKSYLKNLDKLNTGKIKSINFRDKTEGWKVYSFVTERKDGCNIITFRETMHKNMFIGGFLENLYLRPSCHACPAKNFKSSSDLTIADYWGIQNIYPHFDDDLGCSLVLCNNSKGYDIYQEVSPCLNFIETSFEDALKGNPSIVNSVTPHHNREKFFEELDKKPVILLINHLIKPKINEKLKRKAVTFIYKINKIMSLKSRY